MIVCNAGGGHANAPETTHVRLDLAHFFGGYLSNRQSVLQAALEKVLEPWQLRSVRGNNHLAADLMWDAMFPAELDYRTGARSGELRFETTWLVVDSGVNHAAVPPRLVLGGTILLLQQHDPCRRITAIQCHGRSQSKNSAPNDGKMINHFYAVSIQARELSLIW